MSASTNPADQMNSYIRSVLIGFTCFAFAMFANGLADLFGSRYELVFMATRFSFMTAAVILILGATVKYRRVHSTGLWFNELSDEYFAVILRQAMARSWQMGVLLFLGLEIAFDIVDAGQIEPQTLVYFAAGINFLLVVINFAILAKDDFADLEDDREDADGHA